MRVYSSDKHLEVVCWVKGSPELSRVQGNPVKEGTLKESPRWSWTWSPLPLPCSCYKRRVLSFLLWPPVNAHLCLKGGRNRALSSKSSDLVQVTGSLEDQGEGTEKGAAVTLNLPRFLPQLRGAAEADG